jgi:hypothetical protein
MSAVYLHFGIVAPGSQAQEPGRFGPPHLDPTDARNVQAIGAERRTGIRSAGITASPTTGLDADSNIFYN